MLRQLIVHRPWRLWTLASLLARIPISMSLLAFMLASEEAGGSLEQGATLAGVMTFTAGLLGPWSGRRLDRRELRGGLQRRCFMLGVSLLLLAAAFHATASLPVMVAAAAVCGYSLAGLWGGFRALLLVVVKPEHLRQAHYVESLMIEVGYGLGPLSIGLLIGWTEPIVGLLVLASFPFVAAAILTKVTSLDASPPNRRQAPWRQPHLALIYLVAAVLGVAFGAIESNVASRMEGYGLSASSGGIFLGLLATGSCIGGLVVSIRPLRSAQPIRTAGALAVGFGLLVLPSTLAPNAWAYGACLLFASVLLVPLNGLCAAELEARGGHAQRAEVFAYLMAATMMGSGLGSVLNGAVSGRTSPKVVPLIAVVVLVVLGIQLLASQRRGRMAATPAPVAAPGLADRSGPPLLDAQEAVEPGAG